MNIEDTQMPCEERGDDCLHPFEQEVARSVAESGAKKIIAGVSGGADSVSMLLALIKCGVTVRAVHCNFHLRGEESERDRRFVEQLCERFAVPLDIVDFDVERYMRDKRISVEMACRELRYAEFRRIMAETGCDRIAVAHNSDDNAETLILNLMRGAGVSGLRGMLPDTGEIIRPLLGVDRTAILSYLASQGEDYVTDSTNLSSDYARNFVRNEVLPLLETRWPATRRSLSRTLGIMRQEEQMLRWAENQFVTPDSKSLLYSAVEACPDPGWIVARFATRFGASRMQADEMLRSIRSRNFEPGRRWKVPGGNLITGRDSICFVSDSKPVVEAACSEADVTPELMQEIVRAPLKVLWTDLSPEEIEFRTASEGDRIRPLGMSGSTLLSKIMKDARLSAADKRRVAVAVRKDNGEIIWAQGIKRSRYDLVTQECCKAYKYDVKVTG